MTWTKLSLNANKLAFAISFALLGFTPVQAQPRLPLILVQRPPLNSKGDSNSSKPTQDQATPRGTVPAGTHATGGYGEGDAGTIHIRVDSLDFTFEQPPPDQGAPRGSVPGGTHATGNLHLRDGFTFEQPPPDQGAPRGTKPGGERGCPSVAQKPLTALVPVTKEADGTQLRWGLTTKERPTFWFYVPYELKSIRSAKFSLRNQAKQTVYETPVTLTGAPGVISISLPSTAPPLEINKWYQSYLFIDISCEPNAPLEKDSAQGWVKREALAPALRSELDKATTPQQRAMLYAKHGVWYEVVMTLAELRRTDPKDAEWTKLLQSVGLDAIASEPIVNCCKAGN